MSDAGKERILEWLRATPPGRGMLVRGIRFNDATFFSDVDAREFPVSALEQAWRIVADTFQVLSAQRLPPMRLSWTHERIILYCARRDDGTIFGTFVSRRAADFDLSALHKMLTDFQQLRVD
ncbi:MAG TPA: hypothetical protein PKN95_05835 [Verrucomicrobiota bacterium]|nr:hypothetical protein [Verrucomicrobiota bacterium]HNT15418.1 hypothetical protein [Verrucomicrobiota bacterium]